MSTRSGQRPSTSRLYRVTAGGTGAVQGGVAVAGRLMCGHEVGLAYTLTRHQHPLPLNPAAPWHATHTRTPTTKHHQPAHHTQHATHTPHTPHTPHTRTGEEVVVVGAVAVTVQVCAVVPALTVGQRVAPQLVRDAVRAGRQLDHLGAPRVGAEDLCGERTGGGGGKGGQAGGGSAPLFLLKCSICCQANHSSCPHCKPGRPQGHSSAPAARCGGGPGALPPRSGWWPALAKRQKSRWRTPRCLQARQGRAGQRVVRTTGRQQLRCICTAQQKRQQQAAAGIEALLAVDRPPYCRPGAAPSGMSVPSSSWLV